MKWPLMTPQELHTFSIEAILPYIEKEGVTVESVNPDLDANPQIVGKRWDSLAFILVRTACYPDNGQLTPDFISLFLPWAWKHGATVFFASVGVACASYPDKSRVNTEADMRLPIRHGGCHIAYKGLVIVTTSDRVRLWPVDD